MNTTALAIIQADELETIQRTGKLLAASGYFDAKGEGPQAIAMMATKILAGREMGFGPFASVNGVHIIQGKPTIGANLMAAAVKGSGRYDYRVTVMEDDCCTIEFYEWVDKRKERVGVSGFTMKDAEKAGVLNNQTWKKFPRNMLFARAMSNGVRWYCPDIFSGNAVYVPEELGAEVDGEGNVIDTTYTVTQPAQPAQKPADVIFDKPAMQLASTVDAPDFSPLVARFQALGQELYGDQWQHVCQRNVKRVSDGKAEDASELTPEQVQLLVDGMSKLKERKAVAA